jgi:hypothetical protein
MYFVFVCENRITKGKREMRENDGEG